MSKVVTIIKHLLEHRRVINPLDRLGLTQMLTKHFGATIMWPSGIPGLEQDEDYRRRVDEAHRQEDEAHRQEVMRIMAGQEGLDDTTGLAGFPQEEDVSSAKLRGCEDEDFFFYATDNPDGAVKADVSRAKLRGSAEEPILDESVFSSGAGVDRKVPRFDTTMGLKRNHEVRISSQLLPLQN